MQLHLNVVVVISNPTFVVFLYLPTRRGIVIIRLVDKQRFPEFLHLTLMQVDIGFSTSEGKNRINYEIIFFQRFMKQSMLVCDFSIQHFSNFRIFLHWIDPFGVIALIEI